MPTVHIENIGPIERADFELQPGLTIIEGAPGAGKSTALETINFVVNGQKSSRITKRDGADRGLANVDGKVVRISKTMRTEGELRVEGLGDFSIASLHNPPFQTPETRDAHRIKALAVVAGTEVTPESFYHLLGGKADFKEIVPSSAFEKDDPVETMKRVKSAIEQECRRVEKLERAATEAAQAQLELAEGMDTETPHDDAQLQRDLEDAIREHSRVKEKRDAWRKTQKSAEEARARLAQLPPGKSVAEAEQIHRDACKAQLDAQELVDDLTSKLRDAKHALTVAENKALAAYEMLSVAKSEVSLRGELDAAIEAASGSEETTEDEVDDAAQAVGEARNAVKHGMLCRQAIEAKEKAQAHLDKAKEHRERAETLRRAAAGTFDVLSESLAKIEDCPLRVRLNDENVPRLVCKTDRSDEEPFEDLSDGEKLDVIMGIAARRNRLIPLSQAQFGELAPSLRTKVDQLAKKHGCFIVTAQATDGELRGRAYEPEALEATAAE